MVSYEPTIHRTARRELNSLDAEDADALADAIADVATREAPTRHEKVKSLEGQPGLFRIRVGNVRAVCTLSKPSLRVLRVGYRANVYDIIDDIDERRATP